MREIGKTYTILNIGKSSAHYQDRSELIGKPFLFFGRDGYHRRGSFITAEGTIEGKRYYFFAVKLSKKPVEEEL